MYPSITVRAGAIEKIVLDTFRPIAASKYRVLEVSVSAQMSHTNICLARDADETDNSAPLSIVIRTCSLDSGSLTADTEIVRMSHCGHFEFTGAGKYDNASTTATPRMFKVSACMCARAYMGTQGCVLACKMDGCNMGDRVRASVATGALCAVVAMVLLVRRNDL
jgi:hypothetical protein